MQAIHLEVCNCIDLLLYELLVKEVTAYVKHQATVCKLRLVDYSSCGDGIVVVCILQYCLHCIEKAGTALCCNGYTFLRSLDSVTFGACYPINILAYFQQQLLVAFLSNFKW